MISRWLTDDVVTPIQRLVPVVEEAGVSLATLALAWVLRNSNVSAAIVGASRPQQLTANAKAAEVTLDDDLVKRVDEILDPVIERDSTRLDTFHESP